MTIIVDNGGAYSDHTIYFVEVPHHLTDRFLAAVDASGGSAFPGSPYGRPFILGTSSGGISWRDPKAVYSMRDFLADHEYASSWHTEGCEVDYGMEGCTCWALTLWSLKEEL